MASLIPGNGTLLNQATQAPAPSKDYCQLLVTRDQVTYRWWKVSLKKDSSSVSPGQTKDSYEDYVHDDRLQAEVLRVFGKNTLDYINNLCDGRIDYLPRLNKSLLINIIRFLGLEDISKLAQASHQFRDLCESDELWERIYRDHAETPVTDELQTLAEAIGWKKLFFTNKLQLQVQLRRVINERERTMTPRESSPPFDYSPTHHQRTPPTTPTETAKSPTSTYTRSSYQLNPHTPLPPVGDHQPVFMTDTSALSQSEFNSQAGADTASLRDVELASRASTQMGLHDD